MKVFNSAGELVWFVPGGVALHDEPSSLRLINGVVVPDEGGVALLALEGADYTVSWNGSSSSGQMLSSGSYRMLVFVVDQFGQSRTLNAELAVLRAPSSTQVGIYNSAGELVRHFSADQASPQYLRLNAEAMTTDEPLKIAWSGATGGEVTWDGRNDQGAPVSSGVYHIRLSREASGRKTVVFSESVMVLQAPERRLGSVVLAPQPYRGGLLTVHFGPLGPGERLVARGFNLAGELVLSAAAEGSSGRVELRDASRLAAGVYLLDLARVQGSAILERRTVKWVVAR